MKFPADGKTMKAKLKGKKWTQAQDKAYDKKKGWKEGSKGDLKQDKAHGIHDNPKKKGKLKMTPVSKGHAPKGAHGRAAVRALGRTKTTGNFAKIAKAKGKGAAIAAYQNKLKAHKGA